MYRDGEHEIVGQQNGQTNSIGEQSVCVPGVQYVVLHTNMATWEYTGLCYRVNWLHTN